MVDRKPTDLEFIDAEGVQNKGLNSWPACLPDRTLFKADNLFVGRMEKARRKLKYYNGKRPSVLLQYDGAKRVKKMQELNDKLLHDLMKIFTEKS
jgi:hypothetical protein